MTVGERKLVIRTTDMPDDMQQDAVDCALQALDEHTVEKDIAEKVKKDFDKKHGPTWHCIVGRSFDGVVIGSYVTHQAKHFSYYYIGPTAFLLFKSG